MARLASSPCASEYAVKSTISVNITTTSTRRAAACSELTDSIETLEYRKSWAKCNPLERLAFWRVFGRFFNNFRLFESCKSYDFCRLLEQRSHRNQLLRNLSGWPGACNISRQQGGLTMKDSRGFTLIEMVVVLAVIAILAAILTPIVTSYIERARV